MRYLPLQIKYKAVFRSWIQDADLCMLDDLGDLEVPGFKQFVHIYFGNISEYIRTYQHCSSASEFIFTIINFTCNCTLEQVA